MRGLPSTLSPFRNEFNKFNNTGARMLDSIYHMTLKWLKIAVLKTAKLCNLFATYNARHYHRGLTQLQCGVILYESCQ